MGRGLKPIMVIHHYIRPTEKEIVTCDAASPTVMYCSVSWHHSLSRHIHGSDTRVSNPASTMAAQTLLYHFGENDRLRSPNFQHVRPKRSHAKRPPHWQGRSMPSTIGLVGHVALLKHRRALPLAMRRFLVFPHPLLLVEMLLWCHPWELHCCIG